MASTSGSTKPDEEFKILPTDGEPSPFDLTGSPTTCPKQEVTDCNPMPQEVRSYLAWNRNFASSSSPNGAQSSSSSSLLAPPRVKRAHHKRRDLSFSRTSDMERHQKNKDCRAQNEKEKEHSKPEAIKRDNLTKDSNQDLHVSTFDPFDDDSGIYTSEGIPILTESRGGQPLSQDGILTPKAVTKLGSFDDSHRYLNTIPSSKPSQSRDTSETLNYRDSPQAPDSDESSSTTETCIDSRKVQIIDSIVFDVMQWLRSNFDVWRKNAGGNSNNAHGMSEALLSSHLHKESSNPNSRGNKKRKAAERDDQGTDSEDGGRNKRDPQSSRMSIQAHEDLKYACPYFKYNPAKYKDWRTCPGPGWSNVHRVKEHLYRRHKQPQYRCARCWQPFTDEQGLMDHQRTDEPCPLREMEYIEGFDAAQERSLKSRKRAGQTLSEAEKWRRVFKILFPHVLDDDIPSPFYDYNQMSQQDACRHLESGSLAQCEQYMLREVPQRLRQALGRELDRDLTIVEDNLRRRAGDCVRTLIEEVFQELRQIRRLSSPAPRLEANNDIPAPAEGPQLLMSELPSGEGANPYFEGQGEAWPINFDLDFFAPSSILEELQFPFNNGGLIEDLLRPGDDGAGEATKQSDSGYVSNSPG